MRLSIHNKAVLTIHLLVVVSLAAAVAVGQDRPADEAIKVDTNLVIVPAAVLDKQGRSVAGLVKQDFHVSEEGVASKCDKSGGSKGIMVGIMC